MERPVRTAEILAVGTELTTGSTRDTNSGDLARELTALGLDVLRMTDLPDDLTAVTEAFAAAAERSHLVVSSGGLGPTPDDLTREAICAVCGREPFVDPVQEAWLQALFERRGLTMPDANRKQAWLIDGAQALPNERGTAPGWWVERPDGGLIVALPGPPGEMWPMWRSEVVPRLQQRGVGGDRAARTFRLTGVGESALVALIGEEVLRTANPQVATYARADAVDVRVSAFSHGHGPSAKEIVDAAVTEMWPRIERYVFAEGETAWPQALAALLGPRRLATIEIGTAGQLVALLGEAPCLMFSQVLSGAAPDGDSGGSIGVHAERVRERADVDIGLAVHAAERAGDTHVRVAIADKSGTHEEQRTAFLTGEQGRRRAALAACAVLWQHLRGAAVTT